MRQKVKRILEFIITAFLIALILYLLNMQISVNRAGGKLPSLFGYRYMTVLTGSMRPSIKPGDIIISKEVKPNQIKVGDIVTYLMGENTLVTHRVIRLVNDEDKLMYRTKGDYNDTSDYRLVNEEQLIGRVIFTIPKAGYVERFIKRPLGFILFIIIPIIFWLTKEYKKILMGTDSK